MYEEEISLLEAPTARSVPISFLLSLILAVSALLIILPHIVKSKITTAVIIMYIVFTVSVLSFSLSYNDSTIASLPAKILSKRLVISLFTSSVHSVLRSTSMYS